MSDDTTEVSVNMGLYMGHPWRIVIPVDDPRVRQVVEKTAERLAQQVERALMSTLTMIPVDK